MRGNRRRCVRFLIFLCKYVLAAVIAFVMIALFVTACQAEEQALKEAGERTVAHLMAVETEKAILASKVEEKKMDQATTPEVLVIEPEVTQISEPEPEPKPIPEPEPETTTYFDVPLSEDLQDHIMNLCEDHGIDPAVVIAMIEKESCYTATAIGDGGNSFGLMQIQPYWHSGRMEKLGCTDLLDPFQNVTVGVDYLVEMLDWYDGDIAAALTAYNRGSYNGTVTNYAWTVMAIAEELAVAE